MLVADGVLGNVESDSEWASKYEARPDSEIERVVLDEQERRRSRIRTTTDAGTEVGLVVDSDHDLRHGDVLADENSLVIVTFEDREALVISFDRTESSTDSLAEATELGYMVGNRHWDLAVRDSEVLVALGTDRERKVREVEAALPTEARTRREAVDPTLFDGTPAHDDRSDHGHVHGAEEHAHGSNAAPMDGGEHAPEQDANDQGSGSGDRGETSEETGRSE